MDVIKFLIMLDVNANINIPAVNNFAEKAASLVPEIKQTIEDIDKIVREDTKNTLKELRKLLPFIVIPFFLSTILSIVTLVCVILILVR